jgi:hypothetical protein
LARGHQAPHPLQRIAPVVEEAVALELGRKGDDPRADRRLDVPVRHGELAQGAAQQHPLELAAARRVAAEIA